MRETERNREMERNETCSREQEARDDPLHNECRVKELENESETERTPCIRALYVLAGTMRKRRSFPQGL